MLMGATIAKPELAFPSASLGSCGAGDWNELLRSSNADCVFLTREWIYTWCKHLADGGDLSLLLVHQGRRLIGLAPLCIREGWFATAEFPGSGFVGSDYLDFIARRGYEEVACKMLARYLEKKRWGLRFKNLKAGHAAAERIAASLKRQGWRTAEKRINVCPYIPLAGFTWESYLATLGSEHRYSFNRKCKRLYQNYEVHFQAAETRGECEAALNTLIELHGKRWRARGRSDAFHTPELITFHREFAEIARMRGWLRLFILSLNGTPAAGLYGLFYNRRFYFYQSGFDPAFEKLGVGTVTMGLAIRSAIEEGAEEYDLLHGDEAYKRHWAREQRTLSRIELYPPGFSGWLHNSSKAVARSARRLLRWTGSFMDRRRLG